MSKRTLESFFAPTGKKAKTSTDITNTTVSPLSESSNPATHSSYPWPLAPLPSEISQALSDLPKKPGKPITNQPDLNLVYYQPFIPQPTSHSLFLFLRRTLFFHRVSYTIKRSGTETTVRTPRYTTVFGVDATSKFHGQQQTLISSSGTSQTPVPTTTYRKPPRPIPPPLDHLRLLTEAATSTTYNICLVNYYATGADSISYHSDDESFLEAEPAIASFTLGATRDFYMKHKPGAQTVVVDDRTTPVKFALASGDMLLMQGKTQANWLHSIPKRKGADVDKGRINITFRKAMVPAGTDNYYRYNVGDGGAYKWDDKTRQMVLWETKGDVREVPP